jgi:4-hydroxy-tetrahydrodipicolinate synthase
VSDRSLRGCGTALVTPFSEDGSVDENALRALIDWQIEEGVDFLVPCGSTGEAATLSLEEHLRVVEITAERVDGRMPVVAGSGSNDTAKCVELSRAVVERGATHLLVVSPMYNKPPQRGLVRHFETVADAVDAPLLLYNVPGRTASNMAAATTLALAEHPNVIGIKEASADFDQMGTILRERPEGFCVLSGDDAVTLPLMALGAEGVVSVISNAVPGPMSRLVRAMANGDLERARTIHETLLDLMDVAFVESNPIPIKAALAELKRASDRVRLPLVPLAEQHRAAVRAAVERASGAAA